MKLTVFQNDELVADYSVDDQSTRSTQFDNVIYLGRSEECHVVIDDKQISRQHLKIYKHHSEWEFEKVSELGQILLNGSLSTKAKLKNGDVLQFSGYVVNVYLPPVLQEQSVSHAPPAQNLKVAQPTPNSNSMKDLDDFSNVKSLAPQMDDLDGVEDNLTGLMAEELPQTKTTPVKTKTVPIQAAPEPESFADANTEVMNESPADDFLSEGHDSNEENSTDNDDFLSNHGSSDSPESESASDFNDFNSSADDNNSGNNSGDDDGMSSQTTEANYPVEGGGDGSGDDGANEGTVVFNTFATYELHLFGEAAPYDRFIVDDNEVFIGRNKDKCKIFLDDQEVSGVHAVIRKTKISCTLEDLNSSNGTLVNGQRINKIDLLNGDEFVIGGTTFTVQVKSDLLQEEFGRLMPVEEGQEITKEEIVEEEVEFEVGADGAPIDFSDPTSAQAPKSKSLLNFKDPASRKKIIYIVAGIVLAYFFLGEEEPETKPTDPKAKTEKSNLLNKDAKPEEKKDPKAAQQKVLDPDTEKQISYFYEQAKAYSERGQFDQALVELKRYYDSYPDYKQTQQLMANAKAGAARLAEIDRKAREEEERKKRRKEVEALLEKAKEAVKAKEVSTAEALFGQISEKDPENLDVGMLKSEIDAWKKDQERIALEKAQKEAERKRQVSLLSPGKTAFLKKDWNLAIGKLDDFLKLKDIDEDLVKEASSMLSESKNNLNDIIAPLLGQARSLKEGQDLKGAYQIYAEVLRKEPSNTEAITEMNDIKTTLDDRAKKVYREALISENLSLFDEAKEKFQEVQQNTPTDSEYYKKASEKLKNYVE